MTSLQAKACTFCSCEERAEYTAKIADAVVPLCSHHAALLGGGSTLRLRAVDPTRTPRPIVLDQARLLTSLTTSETQPRVA